MEQAELGHDDRYKERAFSTVLGTSNRKQWKVFQLWGKKRRCTKRKEKCSRKSLPTSQFCLSLANSDFLPHQSAHILFTFLFTQESSHCYY